MLGVGGGEQVKSWRADGGWRRRERGERHGEDGGGGGDFGEKRRLRAADKQLPSTAAPDGKGGGALSRRPPISSHT